MKVETSFIPDWKLERYFLDELSNEERQKIDDAIKIDVGISERIERIRESNEEILEQYPFEMIKKAIDNKTQPERRKQAAGAIVKLKMILRFAAASLPVIAFIIGIGFYANMSNVFSTSIRVPVKEFARAKGFKPYLKIFRKEGNSAKMLSDRAVAYENDILQIGYVSDSDEFGVILSIDGNGVVTLHYPQQEGESTKLSDERKGLLPSAYQLDNAPKFERFFFVTANRPIDVSQIKRSILSLREPNRGELSIPEDMKQNSITVIKEVTK